MKKIFIIFSLMVPLLLATAHAATPEQTDLAMEEFFANYSGRRGFTTMDLTGEILKAAYQRSAGKKDEGNIFNGVKRMRIVVAEKSSAQFTVDVTDLPGKTDLKLMSSISENGQRMKIYYKPSGAASGSRDKRNAEFLMFILSPDDNVLIHISGDFDINNVSQLSGLSLKSK